MTKNVLRPAPTAALLGLLSVGLIAAGCTDVEITGPEAPTIDEIEFAAELGINLGRMEERASGLWVQDLKEGDGTEEVVGGDLVYVYYTGWLPDATVIDSRQSGEPFSFEVGTSNVIPAWHEGLRGMKVGGVRRLVVPPHLAYGSRGAGNVPPNAWLVFEIELVEIQ